MFNILTVLDDKVYRTYGYSKLVSLGIRIEIADRFMLGYSPICCIKLNLFNTLERL